MSNSIILEGSFPKREYSPVFLRCRSIAFGGISFFSFLWIVLLCVVVFLQWDTFDRPQQSFVAVMLAAHTLTIVLFIFLLVREFREWLDAARCFLALMVHIGIAGAFAFWTPKFQCRQAGSDNGVCYTRIIFILATSWVIPVLLIIYSICLGVMSYRRRRQESLRVVEAADPEKRTSLDLKWDWASPHPTTPSFIVRPKTPDTIPSVYSQYSSSRPVTLTMPPPIATYGLALAATPLNYAPPMNRQSIRQSLPPKRKSVVDMNQRQSYVANRTPSSQTHAMPQSRLSNPKPVPLPLDLHANSVASHQRNLHYSVLFQQAPRTPITAQWSPVIAVPSENVPPLPSPWRDQKHQSQQSQLDSPSSLEYLKGDSPSPRTSARLSKPSPASRMPSL